jgi:uncharacterized protein (TIGR02001 family)
VLRWAAGVLLVLAASPSFGQAAFSAAVASDYRVRGVSLSQGRPVAQLDASYDFQQGLYAGLFASNMMFDDDYTIEAQMTGYAGYAVRLGNGWSLDTGAMYSAFTGGDGYNYVELHAGLASDSVSARLYFAPDYFGVGVRTLYGEANGSYPVTDRIRLVGHLGLLQAASGGSTVGARHGPYVDGLLGIEYRVNPFSAQFSRVATDGGASIYPVGAEHLGGVWTLRLAVGF